MTALREPDSRNVLIGIGFMCLAVCALPVLNASAKVLVLSYPLVLVIWARFAGHLLYVLIAFLPRHGWRVFKSRSPIRQLVRSTLLLTSTVLFVNALPHLPLATLSAITFTAPFIVTALSVPMLGERVGARRWTAVAVGFIGALIIIRPGTEAAHWAMLLVIGSATSYAVYQILTRQLAAVDRPETTMAYTAVVGTACMSLVLPGHLTWPTEPIHWLLFAGLGLFGGLGHIFVVKALQYGPASVIAPLIYAELLGATLLGYLIFGDFPDAMTLLGAAIIIACGLYIAYREGVRRREG